ncbi:MAG: hypothetical protein IT427_02770 [Pirellulales bacterium]|nr:hypothetical protein [Pirellulales bacterium]
MRLNPAIACLVMLIAWTVFPAVAEDEFEKKPIEYSKSDPDNAVSKLQEQLKSGATTLERDNEQGFLHSLLAALNVPIESQMLVFSKTSLQRQCIEPDAPRAIYYNDDVYVGFCHNGSVIEVSVADPKLGAVFYTLDQRPTKKEPNLIRQTENCLTCHSSSRTESVPGHLVRSLFADAQGQPILSAGSYTVDYTTPLEQRWGGWYVTGTHGKQKHLGNRIYREQDNLRPGCDSDGHNLTHLPDRVPSEYYLAPHSDIVSLMVLEHQTLTHNRVTRANFETQQALQYQDDMVRIFKEPPTTRYESTTRRIASASEKLVEALLFVDEAPLTERIRGTSGFAEKFPLAGPRDSKGRSLRDFDLEHRLFKYPCSYLIYSKSFDGLPAEARDYVWKRLWEVLTDKDESKKFAHLSSDDRQAILEIVSETKPNLPEYWKVDAGKIAGSRALK